MIFPWFCLQLLEKIESQKHAHRAQAARLTVFSILFRTMFLAQELLTPQDVEVRS
jgi:hypothetical protein